MIAYMCGMLAAAGVVAAVGLLADAAGPWGLATLGVVTFTIVWLVVEIMTRKGLAFCSPDVTETEEERTAFANLHRRNPAGHPPIIWS